MEVESRFCCLFVCENRAPCPGCYPAWRSACGSDSADQSHPFRACLRKSTVVSHPTQRAQYSQRPEGFWPTWRQHQPPKLLKLWNLWPMQIIWNPQRWISPERPPAPNTSHCTDCLSCGTLHSDSSSPSLSHKSWAGSRRLSVVKTLTRSTRTFLVPGSPTVSAVGISYSNLYSWYLFRFAHSDEMRLYCFYFVSRNLLVGLLLSIIYRRLSWDFGLLGLELPSSVDRFLFLCFSLLR